MTLTVIGFGTPRFFPRNCISPLCVMKFTHILKAWLAYILYWHSGNMFSLSLSGRLFLSFSFISLPLSLLLSLVLVTHFEVQLCCFLSFLSAEHAAATLLRLFTVRRKKTQTRQTLPQTAEFFPFSFYIFTAQLSLLFTDVQWGEDSAS